MGFVAPELVIFDNDGVLVDSEHLTHRVLVEMVRSVGVEMDVDEALAMFKGGKMSDCVAELERRRGAPMEGDFEARFRARCDPVYQAELTSVDGVEEVLETLSMQTCVASNGPETKIRTTLGAVGLLQRFEGRIFSAYTRRIFKPDPDLFLQAAGTFEVAPERAVVIEDSVHGVLAARAAGMRVLGYAAAGNAEELADSGAEVFSSMQQLPGLLADWPRSDRHRH